jgi:hypothetical protein
MSMNITDCDYAFNAGPHILGRTEIHALEQREGQDDHRHPS